MRAKADAITQGENGVCLLCREPQPRVQSHILPAFAFKALKKHSVTGHIRHSENPNRRVQDGETRPWLCIACEARFSQWERDFCNHVFHPWMSGAPRTPYQEWMLKFCTSVSWRVLNFCKGANPNTTYSADDDKLFDEAELVWRQFLLDKLPHPGKFSQQFLIFDTISKTSVPNLPVNINRFMSNAIAMDIAGSSDSAFTWAKIGKFQIFGIVKEGQDRFKNLKIHVKDGEIKPGKFTIPGGLISFYKQKAEHARQGLENLSQNQIDKIDSAFDAAVRSDPDRVRSSNNFKAMMADAEMFGRDAIIRKTTPKSSDES